MSGASLEKRLPSSAEQKRIKQQVAARSANELRPATVHHKLSPKPSGTTPAKNIFAQPMGAMAPARRRLQICLRDCRSGTKTTAWYKSKSVCKTKRDEANAKRCPSIHATSPRQR